MESEVRPVGVGLRRAIGTWLDLDVLVRRLALADSFRYANGRGMKYIWSKETEAGLQFEARVQGQVSEGWKQ